MDPNNQDVTASPPDQGATLKLPVTPVVTLPSVLAGRYQLLARLGGGGMAQVFRGFDMQLDRPVAVKLMSPKLRADPEFDLRFRREAQTLSKLNDPHVVVVHDYGIDPEQGPFLVMELLHGQTLREQLNGKGPLPLPGALQLGEQLMLGLAHAHELGIVHRDLKPDNIFLIAQSGLKLHVRVLDFGIARMINSDRPQAGADLTEPGSIVGTPRYMAPEQLSGKTAVERSDLYSAGLVLFESLTGQLPDLTGRSLCDRCPDVPADLQRLIEQCLHSNPDDRPVSAAEVYLHLHELARANPSTLVSASAMNQLTARFKSLTTSEEPPAKRMDRRVWLAGAAGTAAIAAGLTFWLRHRVPVHANRETLFDLAPGDHRDDLVAKLGKPALAEPAADGSLAPLVRAEDAPLTDVEQPKAELLRWGGQEIAALVVGNEVRTLMARVPRAAQTSRGLRLGDSETVLRQMYSEEPQLGVLPAGADAKTWGVLYRYTTLGLALEVRDGAVIAAALYPRKSAAAR